MHDTEIRMEEFAYNGNVCIYNNNNNTTSTHTPDFAPHLRLYVSCEWLADNNRQCLSMDVAKLKREK